MLMAKMEYLIIPKGTKFTESGKLGGLRKQYFPSAQCKAITKGVEKKTESCFSLSLNVIWG